MEKIILLGGGGHCKSVIDTIVSSNLYEIIGIIGVILSTNSEKKYRIAIPNATGIKTIFKISNKIPYVSIWINDPAKSVNINGVINGERIVPKLFTSEFILK